MAGDKDNAYSTSEALTLHQKEEPLPTDLGKQVAPPTGEQNAVEDVGIEMADFRAQHGGGHQVPIHRSSRMKWILCGGAVSLVVILAAVLGGVFGSRHKNHGPVEGASSTQPANPSATWHPPKPTQHIAAVSYSLNSVNHTRVYFQDDAEQIIEAANSADHPAWSINGTGIRGQSGSAMAAAVSRPGFPLVISVFYLDYNNLISDISYSPSANEWNPGVLSEQSYYAMANSSLAAMYHQCRLCPNTTIIAFQGSDGFIQIGNLTSHGWELTQLGAALDPAMATGLALQPFSLNRSADRINLYHQRFSLNMSLSSWEPNSVNVGGWSLNEQTYDRLSAGSPIAAASSHSNVSTGLEPWIEVLSVSHRGIDVNTWSGANIDWLERDNVPSVIANSTSDPEAYGAVAVTAIGSAFGIVKQIGKADTIKNWLVADDMRNWTLAGNVDLGGIWG